MNYKNTPQGILRALLDHVVAGWFINAAKAAALHAAKQAALMAGDSARPFARADALIAIGQLEPNDGPTHEEFLEQVAQNVYGTLLAELGPEGLERFLGFVAEGYAAGEQFFSGGRPQS